MVAGKGGRKPQSLYQQLRDRYSDAWREKWGGEFNVLYGQTSCMVAWSIHRQYGKVEYNLPIAVLNPLLIKKVTTNGITITVNRQKQIQIEFEINTPHQKALLEQAEAGGWQPGQAIITPKWALLTLTTTINPQGKEVPEIEAILNP